MEEQRAVGVARVRLGRHLRRRPDPLAQAAEQPAARRQRRAPLFVGERDGHLGPLGERGDQLELVLGQVVEAVEEDRPRAPEGAVAAQLGDRLAGDAVGVAAAAPASHLLVAAVEGGEVAEVGGALERRGARLDLVGLDPRRLQLVEQPLQRARRSRARPAERRSGPRPPRRDSIATAIARRRWAAESSAPAARPAAVATVRKRAPKVIAEPPSRAPVGAELALEVEDVVDGRHDEDRVALEGGPETRAGRSPRCPSWGVRGSVFSGTRPSLGTAPASVRAALRHDPANWGVSGHLLASSAASTFIASRCPSAS